MQPDGTRYAPTRREDSAQVTYRVLPYLKHVLEENE